MKRARKHRKRHMLPGPAGKRQHRILREKSSKSPSSSLNEGKEDYDDDDYGVHAPLHLQLKKQRTAQRATHVQIWDAMCLSLDRILPGTYNNNDHPHSDRWLRQALGVEYSLLSDLNSQPTLQIRQVIVQIDAIYPHGPLDYTVDLVDESSSGRNHHNLLPEIGWVGEDIVRNHPEWVRPGAVWLCHDVNLAFKKIDGSNRVWDHMEQATQLNENEKTNSNSRNHDNGGRMVRMLVINEENVVFVWTEDDAKHVSHEEYIQLLERRADVEGRIRASTAAENVHLDEEFPNHEEVVVDVEVSDEERRNKMEECTETLEVILRENTSGSKEVDQGRNNARRSTSCGMDDPPPSRHGRQQSNHTTGMNGKHKSPILPKKMTRNHATTPTRSRVYNPYARKIVRDNPVAGRDTNVVTEEDEVEVIETNNSTKGLLSNSIIDNADIRIDSEHDMRNFEIHVHHTATTSSQHPFNHKRSEKKSKLITSVRNPYAGDHRDSSTQDENGGSKRNYSISREALSVFSTVEHAPMQEDQMDAFEEEEDDQDGKDSKITNVTEHGSGASSTYVKIHNPYKTRQGGGLTTLSSEGEIPHLTTHTTGMLASGLQTTTKNIHKPSTRVLNENNLRETPQAVSLKPNEITNIGPFSSASLTQNQPLTSSVFSTLDHVPVPDNEVDAFDEDDEEW